MQYENEEMIDDGTLPVPYVQGTPPKQNPLDRAYDVMMQVYEDGVKRIKELEAKRDEQF